MTIAIIYITLGVLYTVACVMDGQDVKPLWKRWLGKKLESYANKLKPIDYCNKRECTFFQQEFYPTRLIAVEHKIGEDELMQAMRDEQFAKHSRYPLPKSRTVDGLVEQEKRRIISSLLTAAESYISIEVHKEQYFPTIYLRGSLCVGKEKKINF